MMDLMKIVIKTLILYEIAFMISIEEADVEVIYEVANVINLDLSAKELQKLLKHHKFNTLNILSFKQIPELDQEILKKIS